MIVIQLHKLKSTFIDGILNCTHKGKVYPQWDQVSASTGRLTSQNPNIQGMHKQTVSMVQEEQLVSGIDTLDAKEKGIFNPLKTDDCCDNVIFLFNYLLNIT